MVVVFPAPFGPMNPNTSPCSSFKVSRSRAYRSPYFFVRSRVSIMCGLAGRSGRKGRRLAGRVAGDIRVTAGVRVVRTPPDGESHPSPRRFRGDPLPQGERVHYFPPAYRLCRAGWTGTKSRTYVSCRMVPGTGSRGRPAPGSPFSQSRAGEAEFGSDMTASAGPAARATRPTTISSSRFSGLTRHDWSSRRRLAFFRSEAASPPASCRASWNITSISGSDAYPGPAAGRGPLGARDGGATAVAGHATRFVQSGSNLPSSRKTPTVAPGAIGFSYLYAFPA